MKIDELLGSARDAITVKRVFGEPYEKDGVTVIPAARVMGSGGGGGGQDDKGDEGGGAGFYIHGRPVGAYVIKDGRVTWVPAVDPNRLIATAGLVLVATLIVIKKIARMAKFAEIAKSRARPLRRR